MARPFYKITEDVTSYAISNALSAYCFVDSSLFEFTLSFDGIEGVRFYNYFDTETPSNSYFIIETNTPNIIETGNASNLYASTGSIALVLSSIAGYGYNISYFLTPESDIILAFRPNFDFDFIQDSYTETLPSLETIPSLAQAILDFPTLIVTSTPTNTLDPTPTPTSNDYDEPANMFEFSLENAALVQTNFGTIENYLRLRHLGMI